MSIPNNKESVHCYYLPDLKDVNEQLSSFIQKNIYIYDNNYKISLRFVISENIFPER